MKIARILIVAVLTLCVLAAMLLNFGRPYYLRTKYYHWRNAAGMTDLAAAVVERQSEFDWIALVDGVVEAGSQDKFRVELDDSTKDSFLRLFHEANTYYLNSFATDSASGAFLEVDGGRRGGKQYWVSLLFRSPPRANRPPCADGYFNSSFGGCFVELDSDWIYELSWLDEDHVFPAIVP